MCYLYLVLSSGARKGTLVTFSPSNCPVLLYWPPPPVPHNNTALGSKTGGQLGNIIALTFDLFQAYFTTSIVAKNSRIFPILFCLISASAVGGGRNSG